MQLILKKMEQTFSICKVIDRSQIQYDSYVFISQTDEEISVVCPLELIPSNYSDREDGWKGMRIEGKLDFSLIGILAKISGLLAEQQIGIFVISTFNTDYIFVKEKDFAKAESVLIENGYLFVH